MTGQFAALGAALAWTLASGLWRSLSHQGSALALNAWKNGMASLIFLPVLVSLPWLDNRDAVPWLFLSGVVGIAAGDSFYLAALRRLGTRRTLTVEALGPVLASVGSVVLMGEALSPQAWVGAAMVTTAVVLVAGSSVDLSRDRAGLALALMAVICGLVGAFLPVRSSPPRPSHPCKPRRCVSAAAGSALYRCYCIGPKRPCHRFVPDVAASCWRRCSAPISGFCCSRWCSSRWPLDPVSP